MPMNSDTSTLTICNQVNELNQVQSWLGQLAKSYELSEQTIFKLDLALNEALPNIIFYAYQDDSAHEIVMNFENRNDHVILEIIDDGIAFDPFQNEPIASPSSLEQAPIDGRGILLINSFTDTQEYQRIGETNLMRLRINKTSIINKQSEAHSA